MIFAVFPLWHLSTCGGVTVPGKAFRLAISRSQVRILLGTTLRNNLRQVVHTYVPLSPSSITWYRPKGGDALRMGRYLQAWRKVGLMAAYRRVDDLRSPAGWLPVHRDQLSSMGSLYLYLYYLLNFRLFCIIFLHIIALTHNGKENRRKDCRWFAQLDFCRSCTQ